MDVGELVWITCLFADFAHLCAWLGLGLNPAAESTYCTYRGSKGTIGEQPKQEQVKSVRGFDLYQWSLL